MLSWLPLEGKLWILEAFFGYRYGSLIFWILYQLSNDRGSFKSITHEPAYDKSAWTCATGWLMYAPWTNSVTSYRLSSFVFRQSVACTRLIGDSFSTAARAIGIFTPKKQIPLTIGWEVI